MSHSTDAFLYFVQLAGKSRESTRHISPASAACSFFDITLIASMAARAWVLSVEDRNKLIEGAFDGK
jgi:hypothetical protein